MDTCSDVISFSGASCVCASGTKCSSRVGELQDQSAGAVGVQAGAVVLEREEELLEGVRHICRR